MWDLRKRLMNTYGFSSDLAGCPTIVILRRSRRISFLYLAKKIRFFTSFRMINLILFELSDSLITDSVEYAQVMTDGTLGNWQYTSSMNLPRAWFAIVFLTFQSIQNN